MSLKVTTQDGDSPIVKEVRARRRAVVEAAGNDLDQLFAQLAAVERDFRAREGRFRGVAQPSTNQPPKN